MSSNYTVDPVKWANLDIFNQMGNIYSEVGRSFKASNDIATHNAAVARAIDLFDATIEAQLATKSPKAREVSRAKQQFLEVVTGSKNPDSMASLDRYFMQFAIAARLQR